MLKNSDYVLIFKALSDETRLKIIKLLSKESLCACHILEDFEITQPTLSYHMKILGESGLVSSEKDGNWTRYSLSQDLIKEIKDFTMSLSNINIQKRNTTTC